MFKERGESSVRSLYRDVILYLHRVLKGKEPEFTGKGIFTEPVASEITNILPIDLSKAILWLASARRTRDLCMWGKKISDGVTDEAEIPICNKF